MNSELARVLLLYGCILAVGLALYAFFAEDRSISSAAKRQARRLFYEKLTPRQRLSWRFLRRFDVVARSGRTYTITSYQSFNVRTVEAAFCLQVAGRIPSYDKLLAQKLLLEADEPRFLALANVRSRTRD